MRMRLRPVAASSSSSSSLFLNMTLCSIVVMCYFPKWQSVIAFPRRPAKIFFSSTKTKKTTTTTMTTRHRHLCSSFVGLKPTTSSTSMRRSSSSSSSDTTTTTTTRSTATTTTTTDLASSLLTKRLPRLYVGPPPLLPSVAALLKSTSSASPPSSSLPATTNSMMDDAPPPLPPPPPSTASTTALTLAPQSIVTLTADQTHYVEQVMRIHSTKRWGGLVGHVRIFNGRDGEWLARLILSDGRVGGQIRGASTSASASADASADTNKASTRRRKRGRSSLSVGTNDVGSGDGAVVECLEQIVVQQPQQQQQQAYDDPTTNEGSKTTNVNVQLYLGNLKKQRLKWVVEKATELGVDSITILNTEYTTTDGMWEYTKHVAQVVEAAEQCERLTVPSMSSEVIPLDQLVSFVAQQQQQQQQQKQKDGDEDKDDHHLWLVCRERSPDSVPIFSSLQQALVCNSYSSNDTASAARPPPCCCRNNIHILVGPEGGWSPNELEVFSRLTTKPNSLSKSKVQFVSLGSSVLRAETAAIAAVAAAKMV